MNQFNARFIKSPTPFDPADYAQSYAPIFRRRFFVESQGNALLRFCALGYGYCYINGKAVSEDLFCSAVSEYDKLVWYNEYNVSKLIKQGENIIAVILGNGFFNENFPSVWGNSKADWRDNPKFALSLNLNGKDILETDECFLCTDNSFITYNELRSGETFNAEKYNINWNKLNFDDSEYKKAIFDMKMNSVERRLCPCESIREFEEFDFVSVVKTDEGYLLDFGVNISGYVRMCIKEKIGTEIVIKHAEEANEDNTLKLNNLDIFYPTVCFQTDRIICNGEKIVWSPKFTYHGFRFIMVNGLSKAPQKGEFKAVFVHQAVKRISEFKCSDELINKIYDAGIRSTLSNMHYALTDCPTREKLGWTNDAQASIEQIYTNFAVSAFMEKWGTDILFSMREDGQIPAIVPSHGWGFGFGPVADGVLFELPYKDYLYTGNPQKMIAFLPYLKRYYSEYYKSSRLDKKAWLVDWDGHSNRYDDKEFIYWFYMIKFCQIIMLGQKLSGEEISTQYKTDLLNAQKQIKEKYIDKNGCAVVDCQTLTAMLLSIKLTNSKPLIAQLKRRVEADNFHFTSGMLGLQYIYDALFENDAAEYAYRLITVKGKPSFSYWFENGATTLWETWEQGHTDSRNHHMMSNVLSNFFKSLLGICPDIDYPGFERVQLKPCFVNNLEFCCGSIDTVRGKISVEWKREDNYIKYKVILSEGIKAFFGNEELKPGINVFKIDKRFVEKVQ